MNLKPMVLGYNPEWERLLGLKITIEGRSFKDGEDLYCVVINRNVLTKNKELIWESQPSSRSDDFIKETRMSLEDAKKLLTSFLPDYLAEFFSRKHIRDFVLNQKDQEWAKELISKYYSK